MRGLILALFLVFCAPVWAQEAADPDVALQELLTVLQDDSARAALIARLSEAEPAAAEAATPEAEPLLATQALGYGAGIAARLRAQIATIERELTAIFSTAYLRALVTALKPLEIAALGLTIALTLAAQFGLRRFLARWRRRPLLSLRLAARARGTALATLLRLMTVLASGLVGAISAGLTAQLLPEAEVLVFQSLFLSAFVVFGLLRLLVAIFASPEAATGRSLSLAPALLQRETWAAIAWPAGVASFGFLFLLPALRETIGTAVIGPTRVLVATVVLGLALRGIWRVLQRQRCLDLPPEPHASAPAEGVTLPRPAALLRGLWAWPVGLAVLTSWAMTLTRPDLAPLYVLRALGGTALAMIAAGAALRLHQGAGHRALAQPKAASPMAARIEVLRQAGMRLATGALALVAVAAFGGGLGLFDPWSVISDGRVQGAFWRGVSALLVVAAAGGIWLVLSATLDRWLGAVMEGGADLARRRTLLRLLRNALGIVVTVVALILALAQLGLDVAPLLAGAGVVGIAIGFGAQKLVQDIITGIFIQLENAVNEGDQVDLAGLSGRVERVSIRSIRLRAADGTLHIIPFSSVSTVSNHSRSPQGAVV